ncbi:Protocadherin-11 X-linked [Bulinus truncatus]|nr:Protocadherin-11 X-linked [Bulinus truncatus]
MFSNTTCRNRILRTMTMTNTFALLCALTCYATVVVSLGEARDLSYRLREEQDTGTYVGNIARDSLIYSQFNASDFQNLEFNLPSTVTKFSVDRKTSTVKTARVLDRETECDRPDEPCVIPFDVSIFRGNKDGGYSLLRIIKVAVTLEDINDNPPQFPSNETTLDAPESLDVGQVLMTSGAVDLDSPPNNTVQNYSMEGGKGLFDLKVISNAGSGLSELGIVLKRNLDRESISTYRLKITAEDGGFPKLTGTVVVTIRVLDVNDNTPVFEKSFFNASVPEDTPERSTVLTLRAVDADEGDNARLTFSFTIPTPPKIMEYFAINETTGDIYLVRRLDYEKDKSLRFGVTVNDNGSPVRSAQATVQVDVLDVNDNAPAIDITLPSSLIRESMAVGGYVAHVSVSDGDSSSQNSVITCNISNDHFVLQRFPGSDSILTVLLSAPLDFEKSQREVVNVTCVDGGVPPLSNSSSFAIDVQNVNDNAPVFTRGVYRVELEEENYQRQFVTQIQAADPDGDGVTYSLAVNPGDKFVINPSSGVIKALKTLDREEIPSYELIVQAKDNGSPPLSSSATVTIVLTDINDNPPKFTSPHFELRVQENRPQNTVVGGVSARDPDPVSLNELRYAFPQNFTYSHLFYIDDVTGVISTKAPLDRETQDRYVFQVEARDQTKREFCDAAQVTVTVTDENDNRPLITYPDEVNNTFAVPLNTVPGGVVLRMACRDPDSGENATVKFYIQRGNERGLFYLNSVNGELVLAKRLSLGDVGQYLLVLVARDGGLTYLESQRDVFVVIAVTNGTLLAPEHGDDDGGDSPGANMAIIVALVCVTSVIAVAVLIAICVIRQMDRRREDGRSKVGSHDLFKPSVDLSPTIVQASDDGGGEQESLKRHVKQDLSFESDAEYIRQTSLELQNKSTFSTFKTVKFLPEERFHEPLPHQSVLHNTFSPAEVNIKRSHYMDKDLEIQKLTSCSPGLTQNGGHGIRNDHWPTLKSPPSSASKHRVNDVIRNGGSGRGEVIDSHRFVVDVKSVSENEYFDHNGFPHTSELRNSPKTDTSSDLAANTRTATSTSDFAAHPRAATTFSDSAAHPRAATTSLSSDSVRKRLWGDVPPCSASNVTSSTDSSVQETGYSEAGYRPNISFSDDSVTANTVIESSASVPEDPHVADPLKTTARPGTKPLSLHSCQTPALHLPQPFTPRRSLSPDNPKTTPLGFSGTPYRLLTTNLSKIQSVDSTHGMYIEGSSLSIFEPSSSAPSRSYVNANRLPSNNIVLAKGNDLVLPASLRSINGLAMNSSKHFLDKDRSNPHLLSSLHDGYSLHDIDEILENTLRNELTHKDNSTPDDVHKDKLIFKEGRTCHDDSTYPEDDTVMTTINAEDLCQEINELFFKDIFV